MNVLYAKWMQEQINEAKNPRRRELLKKGLGHGTIEFLRLIWFPVMGNFDHLHPEYEIRDLHSQIRYLDLVYMPDGVKGCIEIHGYRSHARDIEVIRFKDLCMKQALLVLDDWHFFSIAYLSIRDEPELCKQLVLSFVGKFLSTNASSHLTWAKTESLRFSRRLMRPFTPSELAAHLQYSEQHSRIILRSLVKKQKLIVASGKQWYPTYRLPYPLPSDEYEYR